MARVLWPRSRAALDALIDDTADPSEGQRIPTLPDEELRAREVVGEVTRALARWLAQITDHEHQPVLYVAPDTQVEGALNVSISVRLSPAAVDRLLNAVDALDR